MQGRPPARQGHGNVIMQLLRRQHVTCWGYCLHSIRRRRWNRSAPRRRDPLLCVGDRRLWYHVISILPASMFPWHIPMEYSHGIFLHKIPNGLPHLFIKSSHPCPNVHFPISLSSQLFKKHTFSANKSKNYISSLTEHYPLSAVYTIRDTSVRVLP